MRMVTRSLIFLLLAVFFLIPADRAFGAEKAWDELDLEATRLFQEKKFTEAVPVAERALRLAEQKYGLKSPQRLVSLNFLAYLFKKTGDYARSQALYLEALNSLEKLYGPTDPKVVSVRQRYEAVVSLAKEEAPR